ncbi:alkyl sulfatase dimerization domain-containing protein [Vibrio cyclitrophicus]|uniref:alkyl sulfatase dimerization domain-containing protein n=1 Tax=Vibrio cyclitrophicus TaxID=47951 RepID=UPI00030F96BD|nr:alkyl sulfatase dimerization domain-containing protein [Vibrio cyclitrophicus]OBS96073.1 MBL fold metallo-hydrolase [Vibrio cyclitrophicus]OCH56913.1 MBL fold metallo-hydrolase [Vibrio cyclitrophicus]OEE83132.1 MBL fold metallo-hydrolase [Vibrio cyclitrophicus FF160]PME42880.1 MBL fold metallo-hydrolase [Vibrio cyclitrophicus]PME47568.1 MBL fold metallo-hydrolase [Vibrio cyclitrophicus]
MTNTFKKMALPVAIASALLVSGFTSATPVVEATSKVGQELQTSSAAQYQNIDLNARYKNDVLFEHESNLFWGKGDRIKVLSKTGETLAYTEESEHVHPTLTKHSRKMDQAVIQVDDNVYLAYGFGLDTPVMIEGDDGIIIVDPGESVQMAEAAKAQFRQITDKPVTAIIYSHNHIDHISGVRAWTTDEKVASGEVKIIAQEGLTEAVANWSSNLGTLFGHRTSYTGAKHVEEGEHGTVNDGLGPRFMQGDISFIEPNTLIEANGTLDITISGVRMQIVNVPSETKDEVVVYLPEQKILHAAEVLQGENFPNLHTIRGTKFRDPSMWFKGIDVMRQFDTEVMINSHGRPVEGKEAVADVLTAYRDAIQYTHDQTIRHMNKGLTPDELVEVVKLPKHLAEHPWLGEHYGTVAHAVRQIYVGYNGFFEADPWQLEPMAYEQRAKAFVEIMGGRDNIINTAKAAMKAENYTFAAEILSYPITVNKDDMEARLLKAQAYKAWSADQVNINWRNWALNAAAELEGTRDFSNMISFASVDVLTALPSKQIFDMMTSTLIAENTLDVNTALTYNFSDTNESFTIEVRNGIAQLHETALEGADVQINTSRQVLNQILMAGPNAQQVIGTNMQSGAFKFSNGDIKGFGLFMSYFDKSMSPEEIMLIVR